MEIKQNEGLRSALMLAIDKLETKYILFVEHDWVFTDKIDIDRVYTTLENNSGINYIRFNRWKNTERGWDTIVEPDYSKEICLCKVSSFSNTPHIGRTKTYKNWIANSNFDTSHLYRSLHVDTHSYNPKFFAKLIHKRVVQGLPLASSLNTVEVVVDTKYKYLIKKEGFEKAHDMMGTYLYGEEGSGPYVDHLGRDV
jgi:hypothetical protein